MKCILLFLVLQVFNGYSQSKKEQIADLNFRIDSLKTELDMAKLTNKKSSDNVSFERWLDPEYGTLNAEDATQSSNKW
jgi:hypothetical protein